MSEPKFRVMEPAEAPPFHKSGGPSIWPQVAAALRDGKVVSLDADVKNGRSLAGARAANAMTVTYGLKVQTWVVGDQVYLRLKPGSTGGEVAS